MSVVLNIANLILVLTCLPTSQYLYFLFLAMRSATLFANHLYSLDMPPVVRNTAGVKTKGGLLHIQHTLQVLILLLLLVLFI